VGWLVNLEVVAEPVEGLKHEVDVLLLDRLVGDDAPEEVGVLAQGLVADHDRALGHHPGLDLGCNLVSRKRMGLLHRLPRHEIPTSLVIDTSTGLGTSQVRANH